MFEIERFYIESFMQRPTILHPKYIKIIFLVSKLLSSKCYINVINISTKLVRKSKCTINHFDGLNAILSAYSMPFIQIRNSGQTKAEPAYAASMCNHISSSLPEYQTFKMRNMITMKRL